MPKRSVKICREILHRWRGENICARFPQGVGAAQTVTPPPTLLQIPPHPPTLSQISPHPPTLLQISPHPPTLLQISFHSATLVEYLFSAAEPAEKKVIIVHVHV